jgi:hypothetical protein
VSSGSCLASMALDSVAIDEILEACIVVSGQRRQSGLFRFVSTVASGSYLPPFWFMVWARGVVSSGGYSRRGRGVGPGEIQVSS